MKRILVYENWRKKEPTLIGNLYIEGVKGKEVCSFEYDSGWLKDSDNLQLDPDLSLFKGRQFAPAEKQLFGIFEDSCPDRWGRTLMDRREAAIARAESRKPRSLTESDYLLGVHDKSRMGALRFKLEDSEQFLSDNSEMAAPPWIALRKLNDAVAEFENDKARSDKWLQMLIAPGSSLGGARPKANVIAPDGSLWIAKFPSRNDKSNCGAWEKTIYELAGMCGLSVVESKLEKFSKIGSTFLVKRFDRDDHLRNHGFLLTAKGWTLSPVFDVNPNPYGENLSLNVTENDSTISTELALETCEFFGMPCAKAKSTIAEMRRTVKENWQLIANTNGIPRSEQAFMAPAFAEAEK